MTQDATQVVLGPTLMGLGGAMVFVAMAFFLRELLSGRLDWPYDPSNFVFIVGFAALMVFLGILIGGVGLSTILMSGRSKSGKDHSVL